MIQKTAEATRFIIIRLYIRLNGMVDRAYLMRYLTVDIKRSISGKCSFLDAQFRFIPRVVIYLRSVSNLLLVCIYVILKPHFRYRLFTCMILSTMVSMFRFLIVIPVANMTCRDMVLRKPITLMRMSSKTFLNSLYLSRIILGTLVILTGSTC